MKIGIVTVSFNQAGYLAQAMASVTVGSPHELRYVIVDPGSSDGSRDIIQRHRDRLHRAILEPDGGPADGLNKGFAACDAEVYGYLNSDDCYEAGALDFVADYFADHPSSDVLLGAVRIMDATGKARLRKRIALGVTPADMLRGTSCILQPATFFRQRAWAATHGFNARNHTCWDGELVLDMVLAGSRIGVVRRILARFRLHADSISGSGRLAAEYRRDRARLRARIAAAGYTPDGPLGSFLRRLWFWLNPARRAAEFLVR